MMKSETAHIRPLADLATPMAIRVAATLRLADHVARGAHTVDELAVLVDADRDALAVTMGQLVTAGVLTRDAQDRYHLTPLGDQLRDEHPERMRATLDIEGAIGRAELSLAALLQTVRTGKTAYSHHYGQSMWDDLVDSPALAGSFDAFMSFKTTTNAPALASSPLWSRLNHVIDIGGGDGTLALALLAEHPVLRVTVLEQPGPAATASAAVASRGLADRADVLVGSFFDPLPAGADGYILNDVLHNWNAEATTAILRRCADAAGATGSVFVIESGSGLDAPNSGLDLRMLAWFGGRERTPGDVARLAVRAGLALRTVHHAPPLHIVELTRPDDAGR
ncbi:methyltransferase [Actinomadura harenae]|uniref:Methyltransferase n=1 Tax=Actinomadura harenae TaxID=2483351 RepID=A0A3M2LVZ5_9ACTN|nr:methyltransferase [Actinomadura harenae]RMI41382.1 methyltransferase [Actinomadura harenae]